MREQFFQNRECIEHFSWQFFGLRVEKRKEKKAKTNRECIEKKFTQNVASVNSFQPFSISATICICQVIQCVLYAGFFIQS